MEHIHQKVITNDVRDTLYKDATEALLDYRIATGLAQAQVLQYHCNDRSLAMQLEAISKDYASMRSFIKQGGIDPERHQMQKQIASRALEIVDAIHRNIRIETQGDDYAHTHNAGLTTDFSAETTTKLKRHYSKEDTAEGYILQDRIFGKLWTMGQLSRKETAILYDFIQEQHPSVKRYFVAGLLMALWEYFDLQKLQMLFMFMAEEDISVRTQATLAYVLVHLRYTKRLALYPEDAVTTQTQHLNEEIRFIQHFLFMQKNCLKIYEQLAKNVKKYAQKDISEEERADFMQDAMRDRADLNPRTFVIAYHKPFFQKMPAWWMPYDKERPEVKEILAKAKDQSMVKLHDFLQQHCCDIDMYAIVQMLGMKGLGMKTSMFANPEEELDHELAIPEAHTPRIAYGLMIQNLYRFFSYSKWNKAYPSPFAMNVYLPAIPTLAHHFNVESLLQLHDMLMRTQAYNSALLCAHDIIAIKGSDEQMLLDCAQCHQKLGNTKAALQCYRQAELLKGDEFWLLKQMAKCYMELDYHMEALDCLERISALPGTTTEDYLPEMADCLVKVRDYDKAQQCFFEMKYHNPDSPIAARGIIWCSFQMKLYEKARTHSNLFLERNESLTQQDYIVAGHIEWADGNWSGALTHYQQGIRLFIAKHSSKNVGEEWNFIQKDCETLQQHGITPSDMMLMYDILSAELDHTD